ncbi:putative orphan protein [Pseudoalteromonas luteoviolacea B = ATCC 29581]|nr:putative orphan protein [Pseudoalteromonas luteoviolacea B = ATCC 29581]
MSAYPNALVLQKLIERTHQLLRLYYNKQKWQHINPLLAQLSETYILLYRQNPVALQAQLQLFIKSHGYTTNLVVNQTVIVLAVCHHYKYSQKVTTELVAASLANYLCVTNENNAQATGRQLSAQEKKQWQFRHHLAIKMLSQSNSSLPELNHILMRLAKYQKALTYPDFINLYDLKTTTIAVADHIARLITPKNHTDKSNDLRHAIASFYVVSVSEKIRNILTVLVEELRYPFPGQLTKFKGYNAFCLRSAPNQTHLCVVNDKKQFQTVTTQQSLNFRQTAIPLADPTLTYGIWFTKSSSQLEVPPETDNREIDIAVSLMKKRFDSYQQIEKTLGPHPELIERLLVAASQYNKQQQKAGGLRHSLTMVGLDNAALMSQRVLLEQSLENYAHPMMREVRSRYNATLNVINVYSKHQSELHFESLASPFASYVYYLLSTYQDIKWQIPEPDFAEQPQALSYALIFGINGGDNKLVCESIQNHFAFSPVHKAFIHSELSIKENLTDLARAMVFIKLMVYTLLVPHVDFSAWQKSLIKSQLHLLGLRQQNEFLELVLEQGPANPI